MGWGRDVRGVQDRPLRADAADRRRVSAGRRQPVPRDDNGATRDRIATYVFHPGGPRVLQAFEDSLGLTREDLELSWRNLMEVGNVSSASIYLILRDFMETRRPEPGALGLTLAMGPGFCAELGLLQW